MNIIQFFENLFGINKPAPTPAPPSSSPFQNAVNVAGAALDDAEAIVNKLQGIAPVLPPAFQGYLAAFALAVHGLDGYVDTLETPANPTPAPTPSPTTPTAA
jgi:hypothetical protein